MVALGDATEHTFYNPASLIVTQQLQEAGFNVDAQPMDWGTVQTRRTNRGQLNEGGWSLFPTVTHMTPCCNGFNSNILEISNRRVHVMDTKPAIAALAALVL